MNYSEYERRRKQGLGYETDPTSLTLDPKTTIVDDRTSDRHEYPFDRLIFKRKGCFSEEQTDRTPPRDWIHERLHQSFKISGCVLGTRLLLHRSTQAWPSPWAEALQECISSNGDEVRSVNARMPMDLLHLRVFSSGRRNHAEDDVNLCRLSGNFHIDLVEGKPGSRSYEGFSDGAYRGAYFVYEAKIKGELKLSLQILQIVSHKIMDRVFSRRSILRKCHIVADVQFDCHVRQSDTVWNDPKGRKTILFLENEGYAQLKRLGVEEPV
jgi:hypothetical protein